jgi:8-oxo-dGTP pyrophosphatase MutT (NUDIX family)
MFNNKIQIQDEEELKRNDEKEIDEMKSDNVMDLLSHNVNQIEINNNFLYLDDTLSSTLSSNTPYVRKGTLPSNIILSYNQNLDKNTVPVKSKYRNIYCVNCGEKGHVVKDCFGPITSFGIIAFKMVRDKQEEMYDKNIKLQEILNNVLTEKEKSYLTDGEPISSSRYPKTKFLMIQRKDTMGYTDFVRGKYPDDKLGIESVLPIFLNEMTHQEKHNLLTKDFNEIWKSLWVNHDSKCFKNEYDYAYKKFQRLNIPELIKRSDASFGFQEFGFPKGRRNMIETNIACAEREFYEETGYDKSCYDFIKNYSTIHEEFTGTNNVRYRHIYYLVKMKDDVPPPRIDYKNKIQTGEVQNIGWLEYDECMAVIRPYDIAKKNVIKKVYNDLLEMKDDYICSRFYYSNKKHFRSSPNKIYRPFNYNSYRSFFYAPKSF